MKQRTMEKGKWRDCNNNRLWSGLVILIIGIVFLLGNIGVIIPHWVLTWHTVLILIGLLVGYKRNFEGGGWLVMILIGGYFTMEDMVEVDLSKYYLPAAFIILGLFMIFKPKRSIAKRNRFKERWQERYTNFDPYDPASRAAGFQKKHAEFFEKADFNKSADFTKEEETDERTAEGHDLLDSVSVFGGSDQSVYSKNFKGGDIIAIFGGCNINLTQADFQGTILLDIVAIFGGIKLIVPSSWEVKSEVTAIFGGLDDKRGAVIAPEDSRKILVIKGVALFGGVEIRNF